MTEQTATKQADGKKSTGVEVEVQDLHKAFGSLQVLKGTSFTVKPGEIFTIMGPSGSGKSVLLKHVIGLEDADSGKVLIGGKDAADAETHEHVSTALVFQAGALFNSMTVYDNLALYPREHRLYSASEIDKRVKNALSMLSLDNAANKLPAELSGGMRKRVAIARTLVMEPQVILYDEPTSELDPIMGATISEIIATVREKTGATSIVVSHDRDLALSISDRVALLMDGKFILVDTPENFQQSDDKRVKEFLNPKIDTKNPRFRTKEQDNEK